MSVVAAAQRELPFGNGETLTYAVGYKAKLLNTDLAEVIFKSSVRNDTDETIRIEAVAKVYPAYRWFFDLEDSYVSVLNAKTLKPKSLTTEIKEGKHRFSSHYEYDWNAMSVKTSYRNHKNPEYSHKTMKLDNLSSDGLAMFTNMRSREPEEFTPGKKEVLNLILEDTIRSIGYKFIGRENKKITGLGTFKSLKFTCQLATSNGEAFEDGSEITIWISDDRNKLLLMVESPIRIGSVVARLIKYENLKYALESRVK